ncbi:protein jag [soil metagenome]
MADDLEKYLEGIGISTDEDAGTLLPPEPLEPEAPTPLPTPLPTAAVLNDGTPQERAEAFLVNLLLNFDPAYAVEVSSRDDELYADIFGGDPGKIIGRSGRTLQALEYVTNAVLNRVESDDVRVTVDVGGYKRRQNDRLRDLARQAAEAVRETGEPCPLKPMSAAERRIVHMELADDPSVRSESAGDGRDRKVVVWPS